MNHHKMEYVPHLHNTSNVYILIIYIFYVFQTVPGNFAAPFAQPDFGGTNQQPPTSQKAATCRLWEVGPTIQFSVKRAVGPGERHWWFRLYRGLYYPLL